MAQRKRVEQGKIPVANANSPIAWGEAWMGGQATLLERFDEMSQGWMRRRRDALDAAQQSIAALCSASDPLVLIRVQQDWLSGSWQRAASDVEALSRFAFELAQSVITPSTVVSTTGKARRDIGEPLLSTAGDKPGVDRGNARGT